jgi:hypothetical protein
MTKAPKVKKGVSSRGNSRVRILMYKALTRIHGQNQPVPRLDKDAETASLCISGGVYNIFVPHWQKYS